MAEAIVTEPAKRSTKGKQPVITAERKKEIRSRFDDILRKAPEFAAQFGLLIDHYHGRVESGITTIKELGAIQRRESREQRRERISSMMEISLDFDRNETAETLFKGGSNGIALFGKEEIGNWKESVLASLPYVLSRLPDERYLLQFEKHKDFQAHTIEIYKIFHPTKPYYRAVCPSCGARRIRELYAVPGGEFQCRGCSQKNPEVKKRTQLRDAERKRYGAYGFQWDAFGMFIRWESTKGGARWE